MTYLERSNGSGEEVVVLQPNHVLVLGVAGGNVFHVVEQRDHQFLVGLLGLAPLADKDGWTTKQQTNKQSSQLSDRRDILHRTRGIFSGRRCWNTITSRTGLGSPEMRNVDPSDSKDRPPDAGNTVYARPLGIPARPLHMSITWMARKQGGQLF